MRDSVLFLIVVFLSNIIQAITGFAGTVLAMPFSVMLIGLIQAKAILNIMGIAASVAVVAEERKHINYKELLKICAFMLPGIAAGHFLAPYFNEYEIVLKKLLGCIVLFFAALNLYRFFRKKETEKTPGMILSSVILISSGLVHGLFVCGGPLLVTYAAARFKDKEEFRATLSSVWIILNGILLMSDVYYKHITSATIPLLLASLGVLCAALIVGFFAEKKLSKKVFMLISYILMAVSAVPLLLS